MLSYRDARATARGQKPQYSSSDGNAHGANIMSDARKLVTRFGEDEDGGALIEYTVLLAILLVAVIAIIAAVGGWINNKWSTLNASLP
jgi:pilus assembly protein Flp/PilA